MIIYKNNVIITPAKTGSSSLETMFFKIGAALIFSPETRKQKNTLKDLRKKNNLIKENFLIPENEKKFFTSHETQHDFLNIKDKKVILLVRNPYNRLLSWYYYFHYSHFGLRINEDSVSFQSWVLSLTEENYVNFISLASVFESLHCTDYIKIELLAEDLKRIGIPFSKQEILHINQSHVKQRYENFEKHYSTEVLEHVNKLFEKELTMFGYAKIIR